MFDGSVDQLIEIISVLGTPSLAELHEMNHMQEHGPLHREVRHGLAVFIAVRCL